MNHFFWLRVRRSTTERDPRELSFSALSLPVFRPILLFVFVWPAWHETHGAIPEKAHTHTHTETQKTPVPVSFSFFLQRKEHPGSHSEGGVGTAQQSVGGGSCLFSFILNHRPPANCVDAKDQHNVAGGCSAPPPATRGGCLSGLSFPTARWRSAVN